LPMTRLRCNRYRYTKA